MDQADILGKTEAHQNARESYTGQGIKIIEPANLAYDLYSRQSVQRTQSLLAYV
jgi:hypothetical protein